MKLHQLNVAKRQSTKRVGRGISGGGGKTAGRGTKGQKSRTGGSIPSYFEGGQNPLVHRLPKQRGFKSHRSKIQIIHTDQLNQFKPKSRVTHTELAKAGLIADQTRSVKLLGRGPVTVSLTVEIQAASQSAKEIISKAQGQLVIKPLYRLTAKTDES